MKKISTIITIIFILLTLNNISLAQNNMVIQADKNIMQKDEEVKIKINISNTEVASLTLQIYFDTTKLQFISGPENSNYINNSIIYTWVDENGKANTQIEIGDFVFKAIEEGTANIIATGEFYNSNEQIIQLENSNSEIQIGQQEEEQIKTESEENIDSNNTNLKILRLNQEGITPDFNKDIKQYYLIADNTIDSLDITAIPENKEASVTILGNTNLKLGLNTIIIKVESKNKVNKSEYIINVTKTANIQNANANLETLAVRQANLEPEFSPGIYNYRIEVSNNTDKIDILAIPEKLNANVNITGNETLNYGDNKIEITVTAEDTITKKTYEIIAYRRNEQEEIQKQEEQQIQIEKLSTILEEKASEQVKEQANDNNNNKKYIITSIITIFILVIGTLIILKKRKK